MTTSFSLPILSPRVEVPDRDPSMSQIEIFNQFTVCKQMINVKGIYQDYVKLLETI